MLVTTRMRCACHCGSKQRVNNNDNYLLFHTFSPGLVINQQIFVCLLGEYVRQSSTRKDFVCPGAGDDKSLTHHTNFGLGNECVGFLMSSWTGSQILNVFLSRNITNAYATNISLVLVLVVHMSYTCTTCILVFPLFIVFRAKPRRDVKKDQTVTCRTFIFLKIFLCRFLNHLNMPPLLSLKDTYQSEPSPSFSTGMKGEMRQPAPLQYRPPVLADWTVRERLALATAVVNCPDKNWATISRMVKRFASEQRDEDYFAPRVRW